MAKDPSLYREMAAPFENADVANAAFKAFFADLGEIRKKHGITNVYVVIGGSIKNPDVEGGEREVIVNLMYGDQLRAESMTAWAYGYEQAERESKVSSMVAQAMKQSRKSG
jgi:hypothetical protein